MLRRGRKPMGPQLVEHLQGSDSAKQRLQTILETLAADLTIPEACLATGVGESMFHRLRTEVLQAALDRLEPRPRGRPAKELTAEQQRIEELEEQVRQLQTDLHAAQIRLELMQALPQARRSQTAAAVKKTTRREKVTRLLAKAQSASPNSNSSTGSSTPGTPK